MAQEPNKNTSSILLVGIGGLIGLVIVALFIFINPFSTPTSTPVTNTDNTNNEQTNDSTADNNSDTTESTNDQSTANNDSSNSQEDLTEPDDPWNAQMDDQTRELLEQIVDANGGLEKLQQIESFHSAGKNNTNFESQSIETDVESWIDLPNRLRQTLSISVLGQSIDTVVVWNGVQGWQKGPNEQFQIVVQELPAEVSLQAQEDIDFDPVFFLRFVTAESARFIYTGREDIEGVNAHVIEFYSTLGSMGTYYFHPDSLVAIKLLREGGGLTVERFFSDHRELDGYLIPYTRRNVVDGGNISSEVSYSEVEINSTFEAGLFDRPSED
jgi:hypothetical protein